MRIAVVSSSTFNIYASALIARLIVDGHKPMSVICVRKSCWREILGYFERHGLRGTVNKFLQVLRLNPWPGSDHWGVMADYARRHGLQDWRVPLPRQCTKQGIDYVRVDELSADTTVEYIKRNKIDLLLNAGGELYRKNILAGPPQGVFNVHKGFLPSYRGYHVVEWSLFNGHQVGVTLHYVNTGLDTGDIVQSASIPVEAADSVATIRAKSYPLQVDLMVSGVKQLAAGVIVRTPQARADGRQYFSMHPRLKSIAEKRIAGVLVDPIPPQQEARIAAA